jgi:hypothetical protein
MENHAPGSNPGGPRLATEPRAPVYLQPMTSTPYYFWQYFFIPANKAEGLGTR